ncbi:hypothetical protein TNIN_73691 [Trichonephila inaurata madagascariensis]|uniref:Uncharacterized protein n=1 Tax=Trichonephila inaurata madagascariensis TaxID=2747483 RepID=A0A8X6WLK7_9ARAC|nr:hypothetical protein TNIN_73691 [Trichonephila inaurata madagascariensis]
MEVNIQKKSFKFGYACISADTNGVSVEAYRNFVDESEASETILRRSLSETIRKADYEIFPIYKEFFGSPSLNYKNMLQDASKEARSNDI